MLIFKNDQSRPPFTELTQSQKLPLGGAAKIPDVLYHQGMAFFRNKTITKSHVEHSFTSKMDWYPIVHCGERCNGKCVWFITPK